MRDWAAYAQKGISGLYFINFVLMTFCYYLPDL